MAIWPVRLRFSFRCPCQHRGLAACPALLDMYWKHPRDQQDQKDGRDGQFINSNGSHHTEYIQLRVFVVTDYDRVSSRAYTNEQARQVVNSLQQRCGGTGGTQADQNQGTEEPGTRDQHRARAYHTINHSRYLSAEVGPPV